MKLRKLLCSALAAMIVFGTVPAMGITAGAQPAVGASGELVGDFITLDSYIRNATGYTLTQYLALIDSGVVANRTIELSPSAGNFVVMTRSELRELGKYRNLKLSLKISNNSIGFTYNTSLSGSQASNISAAMASGDQFFLTLSFAKGTDSDGNSYIDIKRSSANPNVEKLDYTLYAADFRTLLGWNKLISDSIFADSLYYYMYDISLNDKVSSSPSKSLTSGYNLNFTLDNTAQHGIRIKYETKDDAYYSKKQIMNILESLIKKYIGLSDSDTVTLADYIDAVKKDMEDSIPDKLLTEEDVNKLIEKYFTNHREEFISAVLSDERYTGQIDNLENAITIINDKLATYQVPNSQIIDVVKNLIENDSSIRDLLKGKDGTDGKDGANGKDGADGKDGKDGINGTNGKDGVNGTNGKDGADGESFEEWAKRNYGSVENFINSVSFEGWAKRNYGSVENFIRNVTGKEGANGKSAYELAQEQGYKGTLAQWLESLKGEDGEDGEDGEPGEDGKDGKDGKDGADGRDGKDGQIVYVNGTYGQIPSNTGNSTPTTGDVTLDTTNTTYGKGGVVNPNTGIAVGLLIPAAAAGSVLLVKKSGRKRGRRK